MSLIKQTYVALHNYTGFIIELKHYPEKINTK